MINAAIVGLGRWGQALVAAVQGKSNRIRFVCAVVRDPARARDFASRHDLALTTALAQAARDPEVDAVFLATPHSLHVEQVIAVAAAGKAVWCEKPLALTRAGAEQAVAACRDAGVPLGCGYNRRCYSSMRELKRIVEGGALGSILHVEGHFSNEYSTHALPRGWRDDPAESPALGMTGCGLHVLDALVDLAGPIRQVHAKSAAPKPPPDPRDVVAVLMEFRSGATGLMATVRAAVPFWRVHVFGAKGDAEARGERDLRTGYIGTPAMEHTFAPVDSLRALAESFADAVESRAPFPISPRQLIDVTAAFEAVIKSLDTGAPVNVAG
ncbi:MAG TPA: Gfo/Idh/MocA family oxidoreductase [Xanthobacteraceae bacterium]|jgi:predicted dehydrogenase|nr:Gfo/Idh/MocA family oxidoreductase [Xanthobacteraceae bacterium]